MSLPCLAMSCLSGCTTTCQFLPRPTSHPLHSELLPLPSTFLFNRRPGQRGHHTPCIHFHMVSRLSQNIPVNLVCFLPSAFVSARPQVGQSCPSCWVQTFLVPFSLLDLDITSHYLTHTTLASVRYHALILSVVTMSCLSSTLLLHVAFCLPLLLSPLGSTFHTLVYRLPVR
jgi:hypothetical protein